MSEQHPNLKITLVQPDLYWESPRANYLHIEKMLDEAEVVTDLIVLPEMFPTGFSMNTEELAELPEGASYLWMKRLAKKYDAAVVGSIITREPHLEDEDSFNNRLHWVFPEGDLEVYNKRHLFSFAKEHEYYSPGKKRLIVMYKGWRICPLICYDLRFPAWSRNQDFVSGTEHMFDLLIYVANWPKARKRAWTNLLEARAHENQVYTCGVNRVGIDGNDIEYDGDSAVFSPKGESLCAFEPGAEAVKTVELDLDALNTFREKFPVGKDSDGFTLPV
ncbi:MAG: amidohydrolase [Salibacteraceae bacterium]